MKTKKMLVTLFVGGLLATQLSAQDKAIYGSKASSVIEKVCKIDYSDHTGAPVFISFGEESSILEKAGWEKLKKALSIRSNEELKLVKTETDRLGFTHYKYDQYYKGIKVEGGEYRTHIKNGNVISMNGYWIDGIDLSVSESISSEEALQFALSYIGAETYTWESEDEEKLLRIDLNDLFATYYPKAEMIITSRNLNYEKREMHYCYKFDIHSIEPLGRKIIYVDATSGEIIAVQDRLCSVDVTATATTLYNGVKTITTDQTGPNAYRLRESGRGNGIETYDCNNTTSIGTAIDFTNNSTVWNIPADNAAHDAHFGAEAFYDYYLTIHNRNSLDDAGQKLKQYVHFSAGLNNAYWDGFRVRYGDGTNSAGGMKATPAIDICGHEFTHGIMDYTTFLITQGESGALNESYGDIMGTNLEHWKTPGSAEWTLGEDIMFTAGTYVRNLGNPNANGYPDTYKGTNWHTLSTDQNGVHKNSTVNSFWYYLVCMGGVGTNDKGENYNVALIGRTKGEKIVYRAMTLYLTGYAQFADARIATIQAATDLYGACSPEVITVTNAWYAVNVGNAYNGVPDAEFIADEQFSCTTPFSVSFTNQSVNGAVSTWDFGDGNTSNVWNPTHIYANAGVYNVQLSLTGACGNDVVLKNSFVTVTLPTSPTITNGSRCGTGTVNLSAAGGGTLNWYDAAIGGSLVNTGTNFVTPSITNSTSYYVEKVVAGSNYTVGPVDQTFGGNGNYGNLTPAYMIFDVYQASVLKTVDVVATNNGIREIEILNPDGSLLTTFTFNLTAGNHTLNFNYALEPGLGYHLGGDTLYMTFTGSNVNYPYVNAGKAAITGASVEVDTINLHPFVFFYNWQFETQACVSARSTVTATVNTIPTATITPSGPTTFCQGGNVTLTANAASSYLWSTGATTQSILVSTAGNYTVTITNANGCSDPSNTTSVTVNTLPTATITPSGATTFCQGGSVTLTANASSSYLWSTGATTQSILVSTSGNYTVTITNANGCSDPSNTTSVTVNTLPTATITPSGATTFCQGGDVTLAANSASSYLWSTGATTQSILVSTAGNYTVTITNANGCSDPSNTTSVTVNTLPTATITPSGTTTFCQGGDVTLTANAASSYLWNTGATTQSILVSTAGNYTVTITNANGCSDPSNTTSITVNPLPNVSISANGATSFCTGGSVDLTSTQSSGNLWSNGAITQTTQITTSGNYSVTYTDGNGCSNTSNIINVSVSNSPQPTISANGNTTICQGEVVTISASSSDSYQWNLDGNPISGATNSTYDANVQGNYTVTVTNANACNGTGTSSNVSVNINQPVNNMPIDVQPNQLTVNYTSPIIWYMIGNPIAVDTLDIYTCGVTGDYFATGTDINGCLATSDTVFFNCFTGIENIEDEINFNIYPNPFISEINLNIDGMNGSSILLQIYNSIGELILSDKIYVSNDIFFQTINLSTLSNGTYFIHLNDGNKQKTLKLMKNN